MKKIFLPIILLLFIISLNAVESRISSVTIFSDRAQITRTATVYLQTGEHKIIFSELPQMIDQNSIQVNGKGNAILRDVTFKTEHFSEITDEQKKELFTKKQELEDNFTALNDKIIQANNEKKIVWDILNKLTSTSEKTETVELDPEKWIKMVEFFSSKQNLLDKEIRNTEKNKRSIVAKLDKINREIQEMGQNEYKYKNLVEILVEMKKEGNLILDFSYIVYGPYWYPVYDLRVDSKNKTMNITYNAMIQQNTSEDWNDVEIRLSTAQPNIGAVQPALYPWYINTYKPQDYGRLSGSMKKSRVSSASESQMFNVYETDAIVGSLDENLEEILMGVSEVESGVTSVVFAISGKNTIASDNQPHKVTVTIEEFPAVFRYSTVPKLSQYAYLKAKITNTSEYAFLPGNTNVFLDNNFVATSIIKAVAPSEEFWTFLGIDEAIKVEYKFVKKFDETGGFFVEKNKVIYEYLIKIKNNKKTQEEIVVWDQMPISQDENVVVKMIEPKYKEDSEFLKMNKHKFLEWFFKPKPGEEIEIPFKFSVEYPIDAQIEGL